MPEMIAVFMFFTVIIAVIFGFALIVRFLHYKETIALAERGLAPPPKSGNGRASLRWGIVITFLGLAMMCGLYPLGWTAFRGGGFPLAFGPWMLIGLLPTAFGLSLLVIYALTKNGSRETPVVTAPEPVEEEPYPSAAADEDDLDTTDDQGEAAHDDDAIDDTPYDQRPMD